MLGLQPAIRFYLFHPARRFALRRANISIAFSETLQIYGLLYLILLLNTHIPPCKVLSYPNKIFIGHQ